ncbi:BMP family ABC transporter substrate-binding protein [Romboutsia maritimum]|uniref:BMP family ABC transporter substrate-binding protein n=1 Tax=Romboutsia maritimum TaxID=2020948 RepID=A0A371IUB2_9FIRM|nr:BMP family ABC transporter substrate-binding protein [Romboutsia maritimum]RDY24068.1 BMP family ABC transporter substrate-binding protein [Romboutsia maritimum]
MNKQMRLLIVTTMSLVLSLGLVGCSPTKKEEKKDFKVGVVLGEGGANDQSFNQSSLEGLNKAKKELGIDGKYLESNQDADYIPNIETFIDEKSDLVIGVGYTTAAAMLESAKNYPNVNFVVIDHNYKEEDKEIPKNMACVTFDEREVSYLVGVIAAKMSETGKVGFIGGMKDPNITRFEDGFVKGVKSVGSDINLLSQYANSYDDASLGKSIANQMYSKDVDVIFSAAGNVGTGAIESAKEKDKFAIGVDMDQNSLAPKNVITSAMKRVDIGVFDIIEKAKKGEFEGGKAIVYGLKEGGVGIAPSTNKNVPEDIVKYTEEQAKQIIDGKIKIGK